LRNKGLSAHIKNQESFIPKPPHNLPKASAVSNQTANDSNYKLGQQKLTTLFIVSFTIGVIVDTILLIELTSLKGPETTKIILPLMFSSPIVIFTTLLPSIASTTIVNAKINLIRNKYSIPRSDKKIILCKIAAAMCSLPTIYVILWLIMILSGLLVILIQKVLGIA